MLDRDINVGVERMEGMRKLSVEKMMVLDHGNTILKQGYHIYSHFVIS